MGFAIYSATDDREDQALFTPFTLIHFLSGMYAYMVLTWIFPKMEFLVGLLFWLVLHSLYEAKDLTLNDENSPINSAGDTFAAVTGYLAAAAVLKRANLITVFVSGLVLWTAATLVVEE